MHNIETPNVRRNSPTMTSLTPIWVDSDNTLLSSMCNYNLYRNIKTLSTFSHHTHPHKQAWTIVRTCAWVLCTCGLYRFCVRGFYGPKRFNRDIRKEDVSYYSYWLSTKVIWQYKFDLIVTIRRRLWYFLFAKNIIVKTQNRMLPRIVLHQRVCTDVLCHCPICV